MSPEHIPVLKPEVAMALPNEPQPAADEASAKLYAEARNSVVKIATDKARPGSGFVVEDGSQIVTTARNVAGSNQQFAFGPDGKRYKLEIEKLDDLADVAVLRIKNGSIPGTKPLALADTDSLNPGDRMWAVSVPHESGSTKAYLSPGYVRGLTAPIELLGSMDPSVLKLLRDKLATMDEKNGTEAAAYLMQPLLETKLHVEMGSVGGPVLNADGKAVGMTTLSNGVELTKGQTLASPIESTKELLGDKGKFEFHYKAKAADWAEQYLSEWKEDKSKAVVDTAFAGLFGGLAYKAASRFPLVGSAGFGGYGLLKLSADANHFLESTDRSDSSKYGLATLADLGTVGGAAMMLAPKLKGYGLALAAAGVAGRAATDFMRNRWVVGETKRLGDEKDVSRPPFSLDELLKP